MIRVLVADDEPLIRAGIRTVLESAADIDVVAEVDDGRAAVDEAIRHRVDVALLDITMPVLDGLSAGEELRRRAPAVRTVMLTSFGAQPNVLRAVGYDPLITDWPSPVPPDTSLSVTSLAASYW